MVENISVLPANDAVNLFGAYLTSGLEELLTYYEYAELVNTNRLPVSVDTDTYAAANTGNSLTVSQRASS